MMFDGELHRSYIEQVVAQVGDRHRLGQEEKDHLRNLVFDSLSTEVRVPEQHKEAFDDVALILQRAGNPNSDREMRSDTYHRPEVDWTNSPIGNATQERRRYPRVEVNWPFTIKTPRGPVATVMKDISAGGAFFRGRESFPRDEKFLLADMHLRSSKLGLSIGAKVIRSSIHYLENEIVSFGIGVRFSGLSPEAQKLISTLIPGQEKDGDLPHGTHLTSPASENSQSLQVDIQLAELEVDPGSYPQVKLLWRSEGEDDDSGMDIPLSRELWAHTARACEQAVSRMSPFNSIKAKEALSLMAERIVSEIEAEDKRLRYKATYEAFLDSVVEINSRKDLDRARRGQMIHDMAYQVKLQA